MHPTTSVRVGRSLAYYGMRTLPVKLSLKDCSSECFEDTKNRGNVNHQKLTNRKK